MTANPETTTQKMDNLPEEAERRVDDNEHMVLQAVDRHRDNIMPVVFNRRERQLVRKQLMEELEQGFEHRRKALDLVLETRLHSIREACNHLLVTGKTNLRRQRMAYFGRVYRQVAQELDQLSVKFLTDMDQRFQKLGLFKIERIRNREQRRLEKSGG